MRKEVEYRSNGMINVPIIKLEHKGYFIEPKLDMGQYPHQSNGNSFRKGYIVTKNGMQAMPGGIWFSSVIEARAVIDILIDSNGDTDVFWGLMDEVRGTSEYREV